MFIHNFKYTIKTLFKNKMLIFWTFAFPLILGTFFNMAFSDILKSEKLDVIDIAIVNNDEFNNNAIYKETFKKLSEDENKMFNIKYVKENEATNFLNNKEITGYLILKDKPEIVVSSSGINETIFKVVVEEIMESENILKNIIATEINPTENNNHSLYEKIYTKIIEVKENYQSNVKDISNANLDYTMIEFYTLIAMTCLYVGILGMVVVNQNLPNMSNNGKRVAISPLSKNKLILSSILASYIVQLIGLSLLFIYTIFFLKIDYGNNILLIILLSLIGSLAGLTLGIMIASIFKTNENTKTGIIMSLTMFGCFLSGMMGITMKYIIDKFIPLLNKINPASMITDGFYSLYYYETYERFYFNIISLLLFSLLMIIISMHGLRRQKYDSI